jgi:MYXO-CTERM domain-containing protein
MLVALITAAWPHGAGFGAAAVSIAPDDPERLWVLTDGWGLARSADGGASWEWLCEESIGAEDLYAVLATAGGGALAATRTGLYRLDGACGASLVPGTDGAFVSGLAAYAGDALALVITEQQSGVWRCAADVCAPTSLVGDGYFPKSVVVDGSRAWATVVHEADLASELWRSDDGEVWTRLHTWPDGDTDPRVLLAEDEHVLVWRRTRSADDVPQLLVSDDAGATFRPTLEHGAYSDDTPGLLVLPGTLLLGSEAGARTWRSDDRGATWAEVSGEAPAVRCGASTGSVGYACGDHIQDGFDVSRTIDGRAWWPIACLETALPATCAEDTCAPLLPAWQESGSFGGGRCDAAVPPPTPTPTPESGCGGAAALALLGLGWGRRTRRG